jgi:uncharacterized membrane-anchored protein YhcB (DUF1043 family)
MQMYRSPSYKPIVWLVILLLVSGLVIGILAARLDLLNPKSSSARQAQLEEDTRHQRELNRLEEQLRTAELDLALERQRNEQANDLELQKYQARLRAKFAVTRDLIFTIALAATIPVFGIGIAATLFRSGRQQSPVEGQVAVQPDDEWQSPARRKAARDKARTNEISSRRLKLMAQPSPQPVTYGENGRHREPSLPVANQ